MVNIDIKKAVYESVKKGLEKAGLPDTPQNRLEILFGMHRSLSRESTSTPNDPLLIRAIEDEIIRLQDES